MTYIWFNLVLEALGKRINFESISNIYGNSFAKDSSKYVQAANPLTKGNTSNNNTVMSLASNIKIVKSDKNTNKNELVKKTFGDIDWAGDLFK